MFARRMEGSSITVGRRMAPWRVALNRSPPALNDALCLRHRSHAGAAVGPDEVVMLVLFQGSEASAAGCLRAKASRVNPAFRKTGRQRLEAKIVGMVGAMGKFKRYLHTLVHPRTSERSSKPTGNGANARPRGSPRPESVREVARACNNKRASSSNRAEGERATRPDALQSQ